MQDWRTDKARTHPRTNQLEHHSWGNEEREKEEHSEAKKHVLISPQTRAMRAHSLFSRLTRSGVLSFFPYSSSALYPIFPPQMVLCLAVPAKFSNSKQARKPSQANPLQDRGDFESERASDDFTAHCLLCKSNFGFGDAHT